MPAKIPVPAQARADAVRNRARLLDAGRDALAEGGLDVSIEEIVRRAGFAKGTFFRHFSSKDALVAALLTDRLERLAEIVREVNATHEPGVTALLTVMERFMEHVGADCSFSESQRGERPVDNPDVQAAHEALLAEITRTLEAAQATGEVRPDVATSDLTMISMALLSMTAPVHVAHPHLGCRYMRLFFDGIRSGTPSDLGAPALADDELLIRPPEPCDRAVSRRPIE